MRYFGYVLQTAEGEKYIGISNEPKRRLREHRSAGPLKGRIFSCVLGFVFASREEASAWEIETIAQERSMSLILNTSGGGWGGKKMRCSEEQKKILSEKAKKRYKNARYRAKMGRAVSRAYQNPECRENLSRAAIVACAKPEVREKRSTAQRAAWANAEIRVKRVGAIKAAASTPEARARRSEYKKQWWAARRA